MFGWSRTLLVLIVLVFLAPAAAEEKTLRIGNSVLRVAISGSGEVSPEQLYDWLESNARGVEDYFGGFPVEDLEIRIGFADGNSLHGRAYGYSRPRISLRIGTEVSLSKLRAHWVLTHEMCHLAFPNVPGHSWLEEGMATYVEPLVRARSGELSAAKFWRDMKWGLPKGQSQPGDRGLAYDRSWGRTYWGGAMFWFAIDLELRRATQNRVTVRDVLKSILAAGGNIEVEWDLEQVLQAGDRATRSQILSEQARELVFNPGRLELSETWAKLGVTGATYADPAPWAHIREGIFSDN